MTTIRFTAPELATFRFVPGQDVTLAIPNGDDTIKRRYTIRRHDASEQTLDVDAVLHGDGPGARWMAAAAPGDRIDAVGPRGKVVASATADWHLFVADESGLAATAAMLESLGPDAVAVAVVEVADAQEEQAIAAPSGTEITWVHRGAATPGDPALLLRAIGGAPLPSGLGHAYVMAEASVVRVLRDVLTDRGFSPDRVSAKAYWRVGLANAPHGEPIKDAT